MERQDHDVCQFCQLTEAIAASDRASVWPACGVNPGTSGGLSAPLTLTIDGNITTSVTAVTTSYVVTRGQAATAQLTFRNLPAGARPVPTAITARRSQLQLSRRERADNRCKYSQGPTGGSCG